jgi:hypothetical protein
LLYLLVGNRRLTRPSRSDTISLPSGSSGWLMGVNIVRVHVMNKQLKFIVLSVGSQAGLACPTFEVRVPVSRIRQGVKYQVKFTNV